MFYISLSAHSKKSHVTCNSCIAIESSISNQDSLDSSPKRVNSGVTIKKEHKDHFGGAAKQPNKCDCKTKEQLEQELDKQEIEELRKNHTPKINHLVKFYKDILS